MSLVDHLRELRRRVVVSMIAIAVGTVAGFFLYDWIFHLLLEPFTSTVDKLQQQGLKATVVLNGPAAPFMLQLKVAAVAGVVLASPVWLYQIWAFIMPGLHGSEKKWTLIFVSIASPLFLSGVVLAYYVLPKGLSVLLGFTPDGVTNLTDAKDYLTFTLRILLLFGISFEIPLFVVLLNLAGIVRARHLARWRSWIIFATFVFAAVATPSTDPITMLLLALPMTALFLLSEGIAVLVDRRRGRDDDADYDDYADDEVSPI
ncbi:MAG: twin-arginine translocase subunit TatC [Nocardioidaceae bacterium]